VTSSDLVRRVRPAQSLAVPGSVLRSLGTRARPNAWPAVTGLILGLLALGPALSRGYILSYDMVFVPRPPLDGAELGLGGGPPRAVPSDLVVALAARVLPADLVQKLILVGIFVVACAGAAALLRTRWPGAAGQRDPALIAQLAAGTCFVWNPFVAERLIMGQWAMLLGYAGLPWVLREICRREDRVSLGRLAAALLPAAVGGFAAMSITVLTAVPVALWASRDAGRRARTIALTLAALAVACLPWAIPSVLTAVHADPNGAAAFAARADTPFGTLGSLAALGGIWNAQAVPAGYGGWASGCWLAVVIAAWAGYVFIARRRRLCPGLGIAAACGFAVAALGISTPTLALLRTAITIWPGFALARDAQQFIAPVAVAVSLGLGSGIAALIGWARSRPQPDAGEAGGGPAGRAPAAGPAAALGVMALLAPVILLPGMAWGAAGRLTAVQYPASWLRARQIIDGGPARGSALLLPWAQYRRYPWNHGEAVYDPWPRLVSRPMVWNDALTVGSVTVAAESPQARSLGPVITSGQPMTARLAAAGVRYVIIDAGPLLGSPRSLLPERARLPGATVVIDSSALVLLRLPTAHAS
jgi:hypothetical protein